MKNSSRAHAAAPPFQIEPTSLGFDFVKRERKFKFLDEPRAKALGYFFSAAITFELAASCIINPAGGRLRRLRRGRPLVQTAQAGLSCRKAAIHLLWSLGPRRRKHCIACDDFFMLCMKKSSRAHAAAPPFQIEPTSLGFDLESCDRKAQIL